MVRGGGGIDGEDPLPLSNTLTSTWLSPSELELKCSITPEGEGLAPSWASSSPPPPRGLS